MALTETKIQTIWKNTVDLIEKTRVYVDDTVGGTGKLLDVILLSLEGEYTPLGVAAATENYRSVLSATLDPGFVADFLIPIFQDYMAVISGTVGSGDGYGTSYFDLRGMWRAIYDHFHSNTLTVESRTITYASESGGVNTGNGAMTRLTVDENAYNMEACHVEKKIFKCRQDQNTGVKEHAEVFEMLGAVIGKDNIDRTAFGSGANAIIRSLHAGSGAGGSLLRNSSFTTFDNTSTETKFDGWTQSYSVMTASGVSQDATGVITTNYYRSHPGAGTTTASNASLKLTVSGGSTNAIVMTQTLANMQISSIDPDTPYFLRIMWNGNTGTMAGGTLKLRLGSTEASVAAASTGTWNELFIVANKDTWARNFNQQSFNIDIEWVGGTGGYVLIDDVIFAPYTFIDGTYWALRGNAATHISWLLDDTLIFTDTGGAPATGKIQYYNFISGFGYLPSTTGTPTLADP